MRVMSLYIDAEITAQIILLNLDSGNCEMLGTASHVWTQNQHIMLTVNDSAKSGAHPLTATNYIVKHNLDFEEGQKLIASRHDATWVCGLTPQSTSSDVLSCILNDNKMPGFDPALQKTLIKRVPRAHWADFDKYFFYFLCVEAGMSGSSSMRKTSNEDFKAFPWP